MWREALLARAVLCGTTHGYRHHPQLERFRSLPAPRCAINAYLQGIFAEATARGYAFDRSKIRPVRTPASIVVTAGQIDYEWRHLAQKLAVRSPALHEQWRAIGTPECHPLFRVRPGRIEAWERPSAVRRGG